MSNEKEEFEEKIKTGKLVPFNKLSPEFQHKNIVETMEWDNSIVHPYHLSPIPLDKDNKFDYNMIKAYCEEHPDWFYCPISGKVETSP